MVVEGVEWNGYVRYGLRSLLAASEHLMLVGWLAGGCSQFMESMGWIMDCFWNGLGLEINGTEINGRCKRIAFHMAIDISVWYKWNGMERIRGCVIAIARAGAAVYS